GRLASSIPRGAAYIGVVGGGHLDAVAAADRDGRVAVASLGPAATLVSRARAALGQRRLVVVDLPSPTAAALADLDQLLAGRRLRLASRPRAAAYALLAHRPPAHPRSGDAARRLGAAAGRLRAGGSGATGAAGRGPGLHVVAHDGAGARVDRPRPRHRRVAAG